MRVATLILAASTNAFQLRSQRAPRKLRTRVAGGLAIGDSVSLLFVGGKGGVGKTSVSGAVALRWAREGYRTLVVSTDPAHSLGDALAQELGATPTTITTNLDAVEVDADGAMASWRAAVESFDARAFGARYGRLGEEAVKALGVEEFAELVSNPPPGVDELVALADVLRYADDGRYDRVVVDTAPTGHALRLLDLPDFADEFVGRLATLRDRVGSLATLAGGMLGEGVAQAAADVDSAATKLEDLRAGLDGVRAKLRDGAKTEFLAVCVPTKLATAETDRLARDLTKSARGGGITLRTLVANRVLDAAAFGPAQGQRLAARQRAVMDAYLGKAPLAAVATTKMPLVASGQEVGGPFGLQFFGKKCFEGWPELARLVVVGGKGGVGKTTVAAALGVAGAFDGLDTIVVSTDPAHSLGDALEADLAGGHIVEIETPGAPGTLKALEVDADGAAREAADLLKEGLADRLRGSSSDLAALADAFETAPPGLDELVSLLKVLDLLRSGDHDRVVLDTAPTGHTLRLLALPELLDDFAERSMAARDRLRRNPLVAAALGGFGSVEAAGEAFGDRLQKLQDDAFALDAVLHDAAGCEFVMVAAPTELSLAETTDLKTSLDDSGIRAERLVVNAVLDDSDEGLEAFASSAAATQAAALGDVEALARELKLTVATAPQFDEDLAGCEGLDALGAALFS